ncbi:F-box protein dampened [Lycorma delicatula]|uniref:F-box protein dampened n=1 Tax=Lycorma delicatula TaxID=130591 RepID=UPI003F51391A
MVSTRQQSNIGGGADNSGSGSGSESSGSIGSSKSLRHHTSSHQASFSNSSGSNNGNNNNTLNNSNNHETQGIAAAIVRSYISTRQQSTASSGSSSDATSASGLESSLTSSSSLQTAASSLSSSSKSLRHFTSSLSNNSNYHECTGTLSSVLRTSSSTRQQNAISSTAVDNTGSALSIPETSSCNSSKSLRHHSSCHQNSSSVNSTIISNFGNNIIDGQGANNVQHSYISNARLLDLPHEILEKIFSYIGYKNVSHMRLVCRQLDRVCGSILNSTFQRLQTQMLHRFQSIKAKMPRRESARRNHPLACESDIIETLHMRLTLLQMSFGKHIERKHCCFFAGEILDEVYRILHYIKVTPKLARPYKVTDELFDLSTMAMEYFKEHIEPTLPEIAYFGTDFLDFTGTLPSAGGSKYLCLDLPPHGQGKSGDESPGHTLGNSSDERPAETCTIPQSNVVLRKRIRKLKQGMKRYSYQLGVMRREMRQCKGKLAEQQKQLHEYASRLDENDKKNEETSRKFSTLLQELNKCKTELQYWRSKSPLNPMCVACGKLAAPLPTEELGQVQAMLNQGVGIMHTELAIGEEPCLDAGFPGTLPGTSTDEVWNTWSSAEQESNKTPVATLTIPEQPEEKPRATVTGKRKASCDMKNVKSTKKPRTVVFKFRSKRH